MAAKFGYGCLCNERLSAVLTNLWNFYAAARGFFIFGLKMSQRISIYICFSYICNMISHFNKNIVATNESVAINNRLETNISKKREN
ncbi:MAG: hypothetical protein OHK0039_42930 [Bacteroidia bacterium]